MLSSLASPRRLGWITSPLDAGHAFLYATGYELSFAQFFPATTEDNLNSHRQPSKIRRLRLRLRFYVLKLIQDNMISSRSLTSYT